MESRRYFFCPESFSQNFYLVCKPDIFSRLKCLQMLIPGTFMGLKGK